MEMSSARTQQTATEALFGNVSKYAAEAPIIVVAKKMDQFGEFNVRRLGTCIKKAQMTSPNWTGSAKSTPQNN